MKSPIMLTIKQKDILKRKLSSSDLKPSKKRKVEDLKKKLKELDEKKRDFLEEDVYDKDGRVRKCTYKLKRVVAYSDGSVQKDGNAGIGIFFGHDDPRNCSERIDEDNCISSRAELCVYLKALEIIRDTEGLFISAEIRSDAIYVINGRAKDHFKELKKNKDLWEKLLNLKKQFK